MSKDSVCDCGPLEDQIQRPSKVKSKKEEVSTKGKYYYTPEEEVLLGEVRELLKRKALHGKGGCCSGEEIEKLPHTKCTIRLCVYTKHDRKKCTGHTEYTVVGEILYPMCAEGIIAHDPGVPVKRCKKGFFLNDPSAFKKTFTENRVFAYPKPILTPLCPCK